MRPAIKPTATLAALSAALLVSLAPAAVAREQAPPAATAGKLALPKFPHVLPKEAGSKVLCEAQSNRVFVKHRLGSECIAYFVTEGHKLHRRAIVFMEGDLAPEKLTEEYQGKMLENHRRHWLCSAIP